MGVNNSIAPTPAGSAPTTSRSQNGNQAQIVRGVVNPNNELVITIVTDGTNVNAGKVLIIQGLTSTYIATALSAAVPDQLHFILKSSISAETANGLADWNRWINTANLTARYIRIVTSDTTLYNNNLKFGIMPFNGTSLPAYFPLYQYAKNGSNGYAKDLVIDTMPDGSPMNLAITKNFYMFFDAVPNTCVVTIAIGINGSGEAVLNA